jgi:drug/metabolite transporter (DMT)-like permease
MTPGATLGELAALGTACCWTVSSFAFTAAAKRFGSLTLNVIRMGLACALFAVAGRALLGLWLPFDAGRAAWFWLGLSGIIGFTIGDLALFRAFVLMGPRLTLLVLTLWPVLAAILGWAALGESLSALAVMGMTLTVGGVAWVILERRPPDAPPLRGGSPDPPRPEERLGLLGAEARGGSGDPPRNLGAGPPRNLQGFHASVAGVLLALVSATCQAVGVVFSKIGMAAYPNALGSTQIRALAGFVGFVVLFTLVRAWPRGMAALRNGPGMTYASIGAVFGPFLGVWLAMAAIRNAEVGVVSTIMAIVPVLIIPPAILLYHERVSPRAVIGAMVAVAGVALLFL